jgi:hypothetical protein
MAMAVDQTDLHELVSGLSFPQITCGASHVFLLLQEAAAATIVVGKLLIVETHPFPAEIAIEAAAATRVAADFLSFVHKLLIVPADIQLRRRPDDGSFLHLSMMMML